MLCKRWCAARSDSWLYLHRQDIHHLRHVQRIAAEGVRRQAYHDTDRPRDVWASQNVLSKIIRIRKYFDHKYGIKIVYFDLLDGSEQPIGNKKYYLIKQKIYSQRFVTDAYSGTNNKRFDSSEYGLNDLPTYDCETANQNEFLLQNSYLINNLLYQNKNDDNKSKKYIWKK